MKLSRSIDISATKEHVWSYIANIENAGSWISGIKKVEILEPAKGPSIVGLKWQETREFMGKDAIEVMWITDANDASFYETRAESHGSIYISRLELSEATTGCRLTMSFDSEAVALSAKVIWALTGWMAKGSLAKTIDKDLVDIKTVAEE
jgi:hypothetical protein